MEKTIILNESSFKKLRQILIREGNRIYPVFGSGRNTVDYKPYLDLLDNIDNLHTDRYKDYALQEAYDDWKNTNFNKNTDEYLIYLSKFKNFMFGSSGFLKNLSYVLDRLNGPLHLTILDTKWVSSLRSKKDWKYSDIESNNGADEFHCFYTTVLKLFQNPAVWNDFFFNPVFAEYKAKYDNIRAKITHIMKTDMDSYNNKYKPLLPVDEYKQLNYFMNEINHETKKVEKGMNAKPELFYDPKVGNQSVSTEYEDDEDY